MIFLEKSLRNELTRTVLAARRLAEDAASKALHALGVEEPDAPGHLDNFGRLLRIRLRVQARQLGDQETRQKNGYQEIWHLTEKIAYDHWHRLLFARFLAENNLLISPEHGVGVSLFDCEELAPALGLRDGWDVAANFAARMLPQIFRSDDPAGNLIFAPEDRVALRKLVIDLPRDIFLADDALGWVYQFWQAQRKEEINKSGDKIGADEIAPVTQLFTEDYMVLFLLHNTLGAWHAAKVLAAMPAEDLKLIDEAGLRQVCALPGANWEYLRFVKDEDTGCWRPAAGNFASWPKIAKELRLLDPCMGSGHFVSAELSILVAMRVAEEGLSVADAVEAVLSKNLFGLEIDPRCTQIAAFNLALAAWKLIGQHQKLPQLNLACCGLGINTRKDDWLNLAREDGRLSGGMEQLYDLFQKAPDLGSLINPRNIGDLLVAEFHELQPLLEQALVREETKRDDTLTEMGVTARGLAHAAEILASQFTLIATNVPYLGRGKQDDGLKDFCKRYHPVAKADLATCFVERCLAFCAAGGTAALVTPQNWLFQGSYSALRKKLLAEVRLNFLAKLGSNAFQDMNWWAAVTLLSIYSNQKPSQQDMIAAIDVGERKDQQAKIKLLAGKSLGLVNQSAQMKNMNSVITFENSEGVRMLMDIAKSTEGLSTGDADRFLRAFWEIPSVAGQWEFFHSTTDETLLYGGMVEIIFWEGGEGDLSRSSQARIQGHTAWGKRGVLLSRMNRLKCTLYCGDLYDKMAVVIIPNSESNLAALWAFCCAEDYHDAVRSVSQNVAVATSTMAQVPFDLAYWQKVAAEKYPDGLPKPHSDDPTQWLFNGHPKSSIRPLQVAVARLLGYRWPRQTGSSFPDCPEIRLDGLENSADEDGIVCLNSIAGEQPAAERVRALLAAAFDWEWSAAKQAELLAKAGYAGTTLEDWLRNGFFEQHCQMFHQRPFIWQIWDGLRDGFSALVNYHKLDRPTLGKLTYTYLGDWIARQKAAVIAGEEGSDAKFAAAQELKASLEKILEGESPYDIFVRWKPLEKQPIGWDPGLNDGLRLNIRPFVEAGILRRTPKINWNKDRGKDVNVAPWFKVFKGDRINDHHVMLAEKRKARGV